MSIIRAMTSPSVKPSPLQYTVDKEDSMRYYGNMIPFSTMYKMLGVKFALFVDLEIDSRDDLINIKSIKQGTECDGRATLLWLHLPILCQSLIILVTTCCLINVSCLYHQRKRNNYAFNLILSYK